MIFLIKSVHILNFIAKSVPFLIPLTKSTPILISMAKSVSTVFWFSWQNLCIQYSVFRGKICTYSNFHDQIYTLYFDLYGKICTVPILNSDSILTFPLPLFSSVAFDNHEFWENKSWDPTFLIDNFTVNIACCRCTKMMYDSTPLVDLFTWIDRFV